MRLHGRSPRSRRHRSWPQEVAVSSDQVFASLAAILEERGETEVRLERRATKGLRSDRGRNAYVKPTQNLRGAYGKPAWLLFNFRICFHPRAHRGCSRNGPTSSRAAVRVTRCTAGQANLLLPPPAQLAMPCCKQLAESCYPQLAPHCHSQTVTRLCLARQQRSTWHVTVQAHKRLPTRLPM